MSLVVFCPSLFVLSVFLWCLVCLKFPCKDLSFFVFETCIFLSSRYYHGLPRYYRVWRVWYYRPSVAVIFYCRLVERYYRLGAVLPPERYCRDEARYYRADECAWGVMTRAGEFQLPIPIHCLSLHVSPSQERRRRPSPDLGLRPLSSDSDRWDRSPPLPLAMEQGLSPNPSPFGLFLCF